MVAVTSGVLTVNLNWSKVAGADEYWLRWRSVDSGEKLSAGIRLAGNSVSMTMPAYGSWVVRVQACNAAGCSQPNTQRFSVELAPDPTPEPTLEPTPEAEPDPIPGKPAGLTAAAERGSLNVALDWDDVDGADRYRVRWRAVETGARLNDGIGTQSSQAAISVADYGGWVVRVQACNDSGCGPHLVKRFTVEPPNRAPVVNAETQGYKRFVQEQQAPRGLPVSKSFGGLFQDPDGDQLTYTAVIAGDYGWLADDGSIRNLAEDLWIGPWGGSDPVAAQSPWPQDVAMRVFLEIDDQDDWQAFFPPVADPQRVTVTVTATDPDGLTSSVSGDFVIDWDSAPVLESAVADEQSIVLTYDLPLRASSPPSADQFTVRVVDEGEASRTIEVSTVTLSGASLALALASELEAGQTVTLDYAKGAAGSLQRAAGGDPAPSFSGQAVSGPLPALAVSVCDRTPSVRDLLVSIVRKECADITADDLAKVSKIRIRNPEQLTTLKTGDFEGLRNVTELSLWNHALTTLPKDIFQQLYSLEELDLSIRTGPFGGRGGLMALPENLFAGLSGLRELDLSGNARLRTLPDGVFESLTSLHTLNLEECGLTTLPDGAFRGLSGLQVLDLSDNQLTTLPEGVFTDLSGLRTMDLHSNSLAALPAELFDGLSELQTLNLRSNAMTALPVDVLDGLASLEDLDLSSNYELTALPEGVFNGLSSLLNLDLSANTSLTELPVDLFEGLSGLEHLDLSSSYRLIALPEDVFDGLSSLRSLDLHQSHTLSELPEDVFDGLSNLEELDLQSITITSLPEDLFDGLSSLQVLDLSVNGDYLQAQPGGGLTPVEGMSELPAEIFDGLSNLRELYLDANTLNELPADVFDGLSNLQMLDLHHNDLVTLPADVFDGLTALQTLSLRSNFISSLPTGVFDGLSSLRELSLRGNALDALSADLFNGLSSLSKLDLSGNPGNPFNLNLGTDIEVVDPDTPGNSRGNILR
ncbi:MAG: leucine-rich repeat protein [Chloroflexi bacterium]|nr:leucine-rich repeat protein [Chloroflexota bacterium]MYF82160.1 leucine-rich repeat protein [Chloroflexota bacterium]